MEKVTTPKLLKVKGHHSCANCGHRFEGKVCNQCGEKVFHPGQLSLHHFVHQTIDIFTHFENKVLKSIWLTVRKPGFITANNLKGVRVPFAKPVQLFIIVNLVFYLVTQFLGVKDYSPTAYDGSNSNLSERSYMKWAEPLDRWIGTNLNALVHKKLEQFVPVTTTGEGYAPKGSQLPTVSLNAADLAAEKKVQFYNKYDQKVTFYSKTLIILLIPLFALVFYAFFHKRLTYYGAALILATHFLTFNLILYSIWQLLSRLPRKFESEAYAGLPGKGIKYLLYNDTLAPLSKVVFGIYNGFEAIHVIAFTAWLFFAFKALFRLHWLPNVLASYLIARLAYFLIFCFYKKFLIAFTLWNF